MSRRPDTDHHAANEPVAQLSPARPVQVTPAHVWGTGDWRRRSGRGEGAICRAARGSGTRRARRPSRTQATEALLDTSACLGILLAEEGSADLPDETVGAELLSSVLLTLEAQRNRVPLARELLPG